MTRPPAMTPSSIFRSAFALAGVTLLSVALPAQPTGCPHYGRARELS